MQTLSVHSLRMMRHKEQENASRREREEQRKTERLGDLPLTPGAKLIVQKKTKSYEAEFVRVGRGAKTLWVKRPQDKAPYEVPIGEVQPFVPGVITSEAATAPETKKTKAKKDKQETPTEAPPESTPAPKAHPKNPCAPGAFFCNQTEINTRSQVIPAFYALYELDTLITSHNPETFSKNPAYPDNCQQRDYTADAAEKNKVEQIAKKLKPHIVITNDPTAANGAPMITPQGVVLGGNGRTMGLKLFEKRSSIQERALYINYLRQSAAIFGLEPDDVDKFRFPVLVRVVDAPMSECATYSNILNEGLTQEVDFTTKTISLARQLQPEDLGKIAGIFEQSSLNTFAELMQSKSAVKELVELFRKRNIINSQNISQFLDPRTAMPSPHNRLNIEGVLLGTILTKKELVDAAQNYTNAIIRALPTLVKIRSFENNFSIIPQIQEAIQLEAERRASRQDKAQFLTQTVIGRDMVKDDVRAVWDALDSGQLGFKSFVERYAKLAEEGTAQDGFGFYGKRTPAEMVRLAAKQQTTLSDEFLTNKPRSASEIRRIRMDYLNLSQRWREFFGGRLGVKFSMMLWGKAGMGKSSFVLLLLDELRKIGTCLYYSVEEEYDMIAERMRKMNVPFSNSIQFLQGNIYANPYAEIMYWANSGRYRFIVIDSLSKMKLTPEQTDKLNKMFPKVNFIFINHANKDGRTYSGKKEVAHDVDVLVEVEDGVAKTSQKNRFGETGREFQIFTKKR